LVRVAGRKPTGAAVVGLRGAAAIGAIALVALLAALDAIVGMDIAGWLIGLTCGLVMTAGIAHGLARYAHVMGEADLVTLTRAMLACGVAALVASAFRHEAATTALLVLTITALILDAVDGLVARHTRTSSAFGAWFDGEVDAFLILVLSVYVARTTVGWVILIGTARYAYAVAGLVAPWLRGRPPPRYWRKVVAAIQGIVLTFAVADILPLALTEATLAVALALLAESFGRDVVRLWRGRERRFTPAPSDAWARSL
jgi:phosphatidylglycerophosphate synthase